MKHRNKLAAVMSGALVLLLAACGTATSAGEDAAEIYTPTDEMDYVDYAGFQFSGADPWDGTLTVTIRSILDGTMDWTFTDSFEDHTLYQVQTDTVLENGTAAFDIQGEDAEQENVTFAYRGTLELKDGTVVVTLESGGVTEESPEGGSSYHMAEALAESGLSNRVVLERTADGPYQNYTVQEGDSVHTIAEEYGLSTKDLCILNQTVIIETAKAHGLEFDEVTEYAKYLYPGEVLLVPNNNDQ